MLNTIYIITDLGPGDGGKGGIVHALTAKHNASIVIKRGGAQGSHGVRTSDGRSFNFSQWGCGTFEGIPTYLSDQMVIMPVGLDNEAKALQEIGIADPWKLISVNPNCIVTTPYHRISSQFEELLRGKNRRGTIGTGVGQAYRMAQNFGSAYTIRASELTDFKIISKKLRMQLTYYRDKYRKTHLGADGLPGDATLFSELISLLFDDNYLPFIESLFLRIGEKLNLKELSEIINTHEGIGIVECSHGVLTDAETGFKPHTSAIRTLPKFTEEMLRSSGYNGKTIHYGVHRAYEIRHGAGPMPTYDPDFTGKMLPGSHKENNRWQGEVRIGALDLNLLNHALDSCKDTQFDGLCLTWFDQITAVGDVWPICTKYKNQQETNEELCDFLLRANPSIENFKITKDQNMLFSEVQKVLSPYVTTPLKVLSIGPTETQKLYI